MFSYFDLIVFASRDLSVSEHSGVGDVVDVVVGVGNGAGDVDGSMVVVAGIKGVAGRFSSCPGFK